MILLGICVVNGVADAPAGRSAWTLARPLAAAPRARFRHFAILTPHASGHRLKLLWGMALVKV